jgi:hypothetical protein
MSFIHPILPGIFTLSCLRRSSRALFLRIFSLSFTFQLYFRLFRLSLTSPPLPPHFPITATAHPVLPPSRPSFVASITQTHSPRRQCPSPKPSPNVLRSTAAGRRPPDPGDSDAFRGPHAGENVVRGSSSLPSFGLPSIGVNLRVLRSNECGQHLISQLPFFCP